MAKFSENGKLSTKDSKFKTFCVLDSTHYFLGEF